MGCDSLAQQVAGLLEILTSSEAIDVLEEIEDLAESSDCESSDGCPPAIPEPLPGCDESVYVEQVLEPYRDLLAWWLKTGQCEEFIEGVGILEVLYADACAEESTECSICRALRLYTFTRKAKQ